MKNRLYIVFLTIVSFGAVMGSGVDQAGSEIEPIIGIPRLDENKMALSQPVSGKMSDNDDNTIARAMHKENIKFSNKINTLKVLATNLQVEVDSSTNLNDLAEKAQGTLEKMIEEVVKINESKDDIMNLAMDFQNAAMNWSSIIIHKHLDSGIMYKGKIMQLAKIIGSESKKFNNMSNSLVGDIDNLSEELITSLVEHDGSLDAVSITLDFDDLKKEFSRSLRRIKETIERIEDSYSKLHAAADSFKTFLQVMKKINDYKD